MRALEIFKFAPHRIAPTSTAATNATAAAKRPNLSISDTGGALLFWAWKPAQAGVPTPGGIGGWKEHPLERRWKSAGSPLERPLVCTLEGVGRCISTLRFDCHELDPAL